MMITHLLMHCPDIAYKPHVEGVGVGAVGKPVPMLRSMLQGDEQFALEAFVKGYVGQKLCGSAGPFKAEVVKLGHSF